MNAKQILEAAAEELKNATWKTTYINLFDIIGNDVEMAGCGDHRYIEWEQNVAEPNLTDLGLRIIRWYTGEQDSFGPLSRVVVVEREDGLRLNLIYH